MKIVALISGGKDSCYNMMQCVANGHEIAALANLKPPSQSGKGNELDSFMYQTVGHDAIHFYSECMDLPLYRREILGGSVLQGSDYTVTDNDETEDLYTLLSEVLKNHPDIQGVSVGAILSNYQRVRVEHLARCNRLGLTSFAYLWRREQQELLFEMANAGVNAILIKVAAIGLKPAHLGKSIGQMYPFLCKMHDMYDLHICGEGGEYETFTIDCPLFKKRIVVEETETVVHSDDAFAQVAYLRFKSCSVVEKTAEEMDISQTVIQDWKTWASYESIVTSVEEASSTSGIDALQLSQFSDPPSFDNTHTNHSPFFVLSGTTAYNDGKQEFNNIEEETKACMVSVQNKLTERGLSWKDVVTMNVFVRDMNDFGRINAVYKTFFDINPSPRALVGGHLDGAANLKIDLVAIKSVESIKRKTMHVQGVSYWAPANIGPYSQSVITQGHAFIAGQIGLVPRTLELPSPPSFAEEAALSLRNLENIVSVLGLPLESNVALCYCYVSRPDYLPLAYAAWNAYHKGSPPPTLYAAVPSLPKGAMVEWQVMMYAPLPVLHDASDSDDDSVADKLSQLRLTQPTLDIDNAGTRMLVRQQMTTVVTQVNGSAHLFKDLVYSLSKSLEKAEKAWKDVLSIRIYYHHKLHLTDRVCIDHLAAELSNVASSIPVITSIAVDGLGADANAVAACAAHVL
ncbi:Diphthine--ammonia ligase [Choanephora cucurbitarum]|uniref:Diphthine--ammonia ligase n=1 Tax=Choanephora cucurbitarum TaxID=101091 RepID=A0A1C7NG57_9FUNG|nr:Diphthine--ammonia ligase [Choanephora cucurbitarum]